MLDIFLLAKVVLVGGGAAAAVMLLASRRAPGPGRSIACWSWAIGAGVLAASGATDQWPHWPPLEDRARFLTLLLPLTLVVDSLTATRSRSTAWIMRGGLAAAVMPILLHNSVYLADLDGPNSAAWSSTQALLILGGLAVTLTLWWFALSELQSESSTRTLMGVLALDAFAAAVTVMLSGYFRAGLLGLGLAASLAGATVATYLARPPATVRGSLGMAVVGIFSVVLMGRFYGNLSTGLAACLVVMPLLAWTVELPRLRRLSPALRNAIRLTCVTLPLLIVLIIAQRKFTAASTAHSRAMSPSDTQVLTEK